MPKSKKAKANIDLIKTLLFDLNSFEKIEMSRDILRQVMDRGLEFPLEVEDEHIRNAIKNLTTALDNYKKAIQ